jgi:23S rRNA (cytosine1962-C5)-methyltransferase
LKGAKKRGREFDLVIVDPPSFSRDRDGGVFSILKDAGRLAEAAAEVTASGGRLFFSTNYEQWTADEFRAQSGIRRLGKPEPLPPIPRDFEKQQPPLLAELVRVT